MLSHLGSLKVLTALIFLAAPLTSVAHAVEGAKHKTPSKPSTAQSANEVKKTSQKEAWQQSLDDVKASVAKLSDDIASGAAKTSEAARQNIKSDIEHSAKRLKELGDDLSQAVRQADTETRKTAQATIKELNEALTKLSARLESKTAGTSTTATDTTKTEDEEFPDNVEFPDLED